MKNVLWKRSRRALEVILWAGVLGFAAYRFGPQIGAALGVGAGQERVGWTTVETVDGSILTPGDLREKVVLVNVWATWCPPCVIEMPGFQDVYSEFRDQGFVVLGVSRDDGNAEKVRAFLREKEITYPVAMADAARLPWLAEVGTLPTSFLIGRDGTVRHRVEGFFAEATLRMAVKRLVAEEA